jgi:TetR/AcrR family transcriptional regulator, transcriptional repressor for nem operon
VIKSERTKQYIIETAAPIFNRKGYAGTSLTDLTAATGLTKGSIYGNFDNKEDIAVSAFTYAAAKIRSTVNFKLSAGQKAVEKLYLFLDFFLEYVFSPPVPGGCILLNTAVEADDNQPVLKEQVSKELSRSIAYVAELFRQAKDAGELSSSLNPESMAYNIFCAVEGAIMICRVQADLKPMQEVVGYWRNQLTQLKLS